MTCLPVYLLVRPLLAGRSVLDLGAGWESAAPELLQRSSAARIVI